MKERAVVSNTFPLAAENVTIRIADSILVSFVNQQVWMLVRNHLWPSLLTIPVSAIQSYWQLKKNKAEKSVIDELLYSIPCGNCDQWQLELVSNRQSYFQYIKLLRGNLDLLQFVVKCLWHAAGSMSPHHFHNCWWHFASGCFPQ